MTTSRSRFNFTALVYILPLTLALLLLVVLPLLYVGAMSFMGRGAYGGTIRRFTVDAYKSLADFTYLKAVGRSICMALKSSVLCILLGYPFTFIVARKWKKSGKLLMFLLMIPVYTSSLARLYSLVIMFNSSGLINTALMKLHIISSPLQILYTNGSITIGLVQYLLPFAVMPLYSSIEKLDEATIEASYDLGAGKIKTFIKVILPMTFPGIIAAKSLGGGVPISAITAREEIMDSVPVGTIGGTYCGNPLACASALKVMDIMLEEDYAGKAEEIGKKATIFFSGLKEKYEEVGDVRGLGSMLGVEFVKTKAEKEPNGELVSKVIQNALQMGLMLENAGTHGNVIRFLVPLCVTDEQLEKGFEIFETALVKAKSDK